MAGYVKTVRFLSYLIRHKPDIVERYLGYDGYFRVDDVLKCMEVSRRPVDFQDFKEAIEADPSRLFVFNADDTRIKINTESMPMNYVPIATFSTPEEAHFYKGFLENEGIPADLSDENVTVMNFLYSNVVGGVKLMVSRENAERASLIVEESRTAQVDIRSEEGEKSPDHICPKCQSENVYLDRMKPGCFWGMILFLDFPIPFKGKKWICRNCHHQWK